MNIELGTMFFKHLEVKAVIGEYFKTCVFKLACYTQVKKINWRIKQKKKDSKDKINKNSEIKVKKRVMILVCHCCDQLSHTSEEENRKCEGEVISKKRKLENFPELVKIIGPQKPIPQ